MTGLAHGALFLFVNGLALYGAWCLAGRFVSREDPFPLAVVGAGLLYFAHMTLVVLGLGVVVKRLDPTSVTAASLVLSAITIAVGWRVRRPVFAPLTQGLRALFRARDYVLYAVAVLFGLQVILLLAKIVLLPPHIWDSFVYHLPPAVQWYQLGHIPAVLDNPVQRVNSQTLGMTLLNFWFFIFLRDDMLVELPQFLWALLLVPVTYTILRQAGVERGWSFKFAAAVFFVPAVVSEAVTTQDHLGLNIAFCAALLFLANFLRTWRHGHLLMAAVAFGLLFGYKLSAPLYPLVTLIVLAYFVFASHRARIAERATQVALARTTLVSVGIVVVIGGYWILRNLILYGKLQGSFGFEGVNNASLGAVEAITHYARAPKLFRNLHEFFPRVFDSKYLYGADLLNISGFGPQFAAYGLIGTVAALASPFVGKLRARAENLYAYTALLLLAAYFIMYFSNNNYRLFSFFPILMIAFAAVVLHRSGVFEQRLASGITGGVLIASIAWCFVLLVPPQYTNLLQLKEFATMDAGLRTTGRYTRWFVHERPNFYWLLGRMPTDQPVAVISQPRQGFELETPDDVWTYTYYDRHWRRHVSFLDQGRYLDCDEHQRCTPKDDLRQELASRKISLVSLCKANRCLELRAPDFFELTPGFYWYTGGDHER